MICIEYLCLKNNNYDWNDYINANTIKSINSILLKGIESICGEDKTVPNHVIKPDGTMHEFVDPIHVQQQMEQLFTWIYNNIDTDLHPIIIPAISHYSFVRIHPFIDCNGRGARLLMNMILYKYGYPIGIIKVEDVSIYYHGLDMADDGNLESLIIIIANAVKQELTFTQSFLENSAKENC